MNLFQIGEPYSSGDPQTQQNIRTYYNEESSEEKPRTNKASSAFVDRKS